MAMLFMLEQRLSYKGTHPLLSCEDIISLLCNFLPKRSISSEEVLRQLEVRHQKREASIKSAYRKQRKKHSLSLLKSFICNRFVPVQKVDFSFKSAQVLVSICFYLNFLCSATFF